MNSERLRAIANNIFPEDIVLDVGCDHGYLGIYLEKNHLCKKVYASDISEKALDTARHNFKKNRVNIESFVSDGFQNIDVFFNTAVLAGMGTNTILKILASEKVPPKLILASNNEIPKLRKSLNVMGYKIVDEQAIWEKGHYYIILLCIKGEQKLNKKEVLFGISNNDQYYAYLIKQNNNLLKKVPFRKKITLYYHNIILKGLIKRK